MKQEPDNSNSAIKVTALIQTPITHTIFKLQPDENPINTKKLETRTEKRKTPITHLVKSFYMNPKNLEMANPAALC